MKSNIIVGGLGLMAAFAANAQNRPNILYIMCDDMGYGDLACYGQRYISTPNIDRLAAEGMRFSQAYAGSPVSAPSRATFMTGQHSGHTHVRGNKEYWRYDNMVKYGNNSDFAVVGQEPYDTAHVIIPEIFKDNGYTTGMFGKWAGGYEGSVSTPDKRGIDEYYGFICQFQAHLYYPNFLNAYTARLATRACVAKCWKRTSNIPCLVRNIKSAHNIRPTSSTKRLSNGSISRRKISLSSASSPIPCRMPNSLSRKTLSSWPTRDTSVRRKPSAVTRVRAITQRTTVMRSLLA